MACFMVSFVLILEQVGPGQAVLVGIGEAGVIVSQSRPSRGLLRDCKTSDNLRVKLYCPMSGINIPFAVGELVLGLEAALLRDWRMLQLVAHGPVLALGLVSLDIIDIVDMDMVDIVDFIDMIDIIL